MFLKGKILYGKINFYLLNYVVNLRKFKFKKSMTPTYKRKKL